MLYAIYWRRCSTRPAPNARTRIHPRARQVRLPGFLCARMQGCKGATVQVLAESCTLQFLPTQRPTHRTAKTDKNNSVTFGSALGIARTPKKHLRHLCWKRSGRSGGSAPKYDCWPASWPALANCQMSKCCRDGGGDASAQICAFASASQRLIVAWSTPTASAISVWLQHSSHISYALACCCSLHAQAQRDRAGYQAVVSDGGH